MIIARFSHLLLQTLVKSLFCIGASVFGLRHRMIVLLLSGLHNELLQLVFMRLLLPTP